MFYKFRECLILPISIHLLPIVLGVWFITEELSSSQSFLEVIHLGTIDLAIITKSEFLDELFLVVMTSIIVQ